MKLVRYLHDGRIRGGVIDAVGSVRELPPHWLDPATAEDDLLPPALLAVDADALPPAPKDLRLVCPVPRVFQFIGVGLNYCDHAREAGMPIPTEPVIFMKAASCVGGPNDDLILPPGSSKTDWEVELGVVIGRRTEHVKEHAALEHVAGYVVVNDVSEREYQLERGGTWDKGKGCPTFGPIGPWLVTKDEIPDPQALDLWLEVNGELMQRSNTGQMIFSCAEIVAYLSRFVTLMPGDIITTGTPPGVGLGMNPPRYLQAGDVVTLGITGLGVQRQEVRAYR